MRWSRWEVDEEEIDCEDLFAYDMESQRKVIGEFDLWFSFFRYQRRAFNDKSKKMTDQAVERVGNVSARRWWDNGKV